MPDEQTRLSEVDELVVPFCYGTVAWWLGKKAADYHSHKWTVYVRGADNEDLSIYIDKVVFSLHPSFHNHVREVTQVPFELSETGWGEFEITITIHWRSDSGAKPTEMYVTSFMYLCQSHT
mmetsp:Transcript_5862/g.20437  ORF Transcript_5862/g.20437 Transcript_5862/m.20437 type:complete len:121 (-) Transcript_5862:2958-3320(-)